MTDPLQNPSDLSREENLSLLRTINSGAALYLFTIHIPSGEVRGMDGMPLQIPHHNVNIKNVSELRTWLGDNGFQSMRSLVDKASEISRITPSHGNTPYSIICHINPATQRRYGWKIRLIPLRFDECGNPVIIVGILSPAIKVEGDDSKAIVICCGGRHITRLILHDDDNFWMKEDCFFFSNREVNVIRMTSTGASTKEIADTLHVSEPTVKNDKKSVCIKTGARNTIDAIRILHSYGLISLE